MRATLGVVFSDLLDDDFMKKCKYCGQEHPNLGMTIIPSCVDVLIEKQKAEIATLRDVLEHTPCTCERTHLRETGEIAFGPGRIVRECARCKFLKAESSNASS